MLCQVTHCTGQVLPNTRPHQLPQLIPRAHKYTATHTHVPSIVRLCSPPPNLSLSQVHRRCLYDDGRGVGEPLNETGQFGDGLIIRGKHVVLLDNIENSTLYHRLVAEGLMIEPVHGVQPSTDSPSDIVAKYFTNVSQCTILLPAHAEKKAEKDV